MKLEVSLKDIDVVAWWGAILATVLLIWDIYKWKTSGARLRLRVSSDMQAIGGGVKDDKTYLLVVASNIGDRPTTITHLTLRHYASALKRLMNKSAHAMLVTSPSPGQPIPCKLGPGEEWMGMIIQDAELEQMATNGTLEVQLVHSQSERPSRKVVTIKPNAQPAVPGDGPRAARSARP